MTLIGERSTCLETNMEIERLPIHGGTAKSFRGPWTVAGAPWR